MPNPNDIPQPQGRIAPNHLGVYKGSFLVNNIPQLKVSIEPSLGLTQNQVDVSRGTLLTPTQPADPGRYSGRYPPANTILPTGHVFNRGEPPIMFPAPAALYRFDGDATDASGNGRDLSGTITYAVGKFGQAFRSGEVTGTIPITQVNADYSLGGWFKVLSTGYSDYAQITLESAGAVQRVCLGFGGSEAGFQYFVGFNDGFSAPIFGAMVPNGVWIFVCVVVSGGTATLYYGDVSQGTSDVSAFSSTMAFSRFSGASGTGGATLDDPFFVQLALTPDRIAYLAAGNKYPVQN